jgi:site-specific DNA-methyltransferase (adenine-specific)
MRDIPDGTFTAIVTDPPYSLDFMGKTWDKVLPPVEVWRECLRVLRPGGHALIFGGTRTYHRLACAVEDAGFEVRDCLMWLYGQGFPKSLNVSKAIDKAAGAEREIVGRGSSGRTAIGGTGDRALSGTDGTLGHDITAPATEAARLWSGYGTALKPAWEPILLARKPLVGTVERNCREHGTGALNIDGCRIAAVPGDYDHPGDLTKRPMARNSFAAAEHGDLKVTQAPPNESGRWPANLILDEEAAALLDEQTGESVSRKGQPRGSAKPGEGWGMTKTGAEYDDVGGASRFFYCSKASKRDRGEGNDHPTVKPVELMRWLVRLVKGPGENLILDPFAGSGTTGVACQLEDVPFVLIEREPQYVEIIRQRLSEVPG